MTGPLRLIPAAALGLLLASAADAEVHHLSTHGEWSVALEVNDDGMACAASTSNRADEILDVTITDKAQITLYVIFEGNPGVSEIDFDVVIAGSDRWELENATMTQYGIFFNFPEAALALEFMIDLQAGTSFGLARAGETKTYGNFSLNGSRDAIDGLFECYRRISGVGA